MTTDSDRPPVIPLTEEFNYTVMWKSAADLGLSKYEVSANGFGRDQQPVRRIDNGRPLTASVGSNGYLRVKPYGDDGKQRTIEVHALVLGVYAGSPQDGMETRHLDGDPFNNRWRPGGEAETRAAGGNLIYGTKPENHADQVAAGTATRPTVPCVNYQRCGGQVAKQGSRCLPCAQEIGRRAAAMLDAGMSLETVARRLGYSSPDWVYKLATRHGGYDQPSADARAQGRRWPQRVAATVRYRLRSGTVSR